MESKKEMERRMKKDDCKYCGESQAFSHLNFSLTFKAEHVSPLHSLANGTQNGVSMVKLFVSERISKG